MYFYWMLDQTKLSSILTMATHSNELASRGQKYRFYPHGPVRRISHPNFPAHARKRLDKPIRKTYKKV